MDNAQLVNLAIFTGLKVINIRGSSLAGKTLCYLKLVKKSYVNAMSL
jgi:hypothetical protein